MPAGLSRRPVALLVHTTVSLYRSQPPVDQADHPGYERPHHGHGDEAAAAGHEPGHGRAPSPGNGIEMLMGQKINFMIKFLVSYLLMMN